MKLNEVLTQPTLYIAIGPSGSGKSTYFKQLQQEDPSIQYYSWDALRHEFYDKDDYRKAWQMSTFDKTFGKRVRARFDDLMSTGSSIYVDNTNVTSKARKPYLDKAKQLGYRTVGLYFKTPLETVLDRQKTRSDKSVPEDAVRRQWFLANVDVDGIPTAGEFDQLIEIK